LGRGEKICTHPSTYRSEGRFLKKFSDHCVKERERLISFEGGSWGRKKKEHQRPRRGGSMSCWEGRADSVRGFRRKGQAGHSFLSNERVEGRNGRIGGGKRSQRLKREEASWNEKKKKQQTDFLSALTCWGGKLVACQTRKFKSKILGYSLFKTAGRNDWKLEQS